MYLSNLVKFSNKKYKKIPVNGISFDSRVVKKRDIFFSIKGSKTSGSNFINEAISRGASAIIINKQTSVKNFKIPLIKVSDVRASLSKACSIFYNKKPTNVIAITGTNGKSSVADFYYQLLSLSKIPVASIGTLGIHSKKYNKKTNLTTINPLSLHKHLKTLKEKKINNVILEASSHGLAQKRLDNLNIKIGVFTNLSQDHLDYHKNMKSYFNSKLHLFKNLLKKNSKIITDKENKEFKIIKIIAKEKNIQLFTIGLKNADLKILHHRYEKNSQIVKISIKSEIIVLKIPLIGFWQVKNLLMAVLLALKSGVDKKKIVKNILKIKPVPGRLECIKNLANNSRVIIDFAHTPDALKQSLTALKKQFNKKILLVFGCGGERDQKKRILMGKIAKKYCKKIFVTDDNPRNENPKSIRKSIIKGCKNLSVEIGNRKKAIKVAINELEPNEILLVAGKGHEENQIYGNKKIKFSDKKVIKEILSNKKFKNYQNHLLHKAFSNKKLKNICYKGVSINTKTIKNKNLFFAIRGKKNDGHEFVNHAIKKGASKVIVSKNVQKISKNKLIKVQNTHSSLNNLAKITRENSSAKIIGITGSVGKTTLKNLISFALKNYGKVCFSPFSYNNKFGVPISVANLEKNTEYGVFEMGMDKKGEINKLSQIVKPEIAIITNISEAHLKNFNNIKDIAKAKAEIINNIMDGGSIILNKDGKFFNFLSNKAKKRNIKVFSYSLKSKSDVYLAGIKKINSIYRLKVIIEKNSFYFNIKYPHVNLINNILACVTVLFILDLNLGKMKKNFINFTIPSGRGDIKTVKKFNKVFKFIDESYNANPLSMASAIRNMSYYKIKKRGKKLVFLGDMLELGKQSKKLHRSLSRLINKSDIDKVFVYGHNIKETFNFLSKSKKGIIFKNLKDAYIHFNQIIKNNDLLMVKGSNATGLNLFSKNIKKEQFSAL
jgi:MurE/MurF fusion protein